MIVAKGPPTNSGGVYCVARYSEPEHLYKPAGKGILCYHQNEAKKLVEYVASLIAKEGVAEEEVRREIIRARDSIVRTIVE